MSNGFCLRNEHYHANKYWAKQACDGYENIREVTSLFNNGATMKFCAGRIRQIPALGVCHNAQVYLKVALTCTRKDNFSACIFKALEVQKKSYDDFASSVNR